LEFLSTLNVPAYKIGSGEVKNWTFIKKTASMNKPVILSTGMYTMEDIGEALEVIADAGNPHVAVLHCTTSYPTTPTEVNLCAMDTIRHTYGVMVGYSDHTGGFHFPLAATARGACIIEKHITLDFDIPDAQDWKVSCGADDFPIMVRQIREIESGLGAGIKVPCEAEKASLQWARKSLVASVDIPEGDVLTYDKISTKRPGFGIIPTEIYKVIGRKSKRAIKKDTLIRMEDLI
jgi:N-acetylneuraminate synthase/N,N'-diacetyllegionaminate synthase